MPAQKKAPNRRQRQRPRTSAATQARVLALVPPTRLPTLPASRFRSSKPLAETRVRWKAFWGSELAGLVQDADHPALVRLFMLYDERERAWSGYMKRRLVDGSTGQMVLNPLFKAVKDMDAEIQSLEDRFGLTPKARFQLGISVGQAARSLSDLNKELDADPNEDSGDDSAEDPRLSGTAVDVPGKKH